MLVFVREVAIGILLSFQQTIRIVAIISSFRPPVKKPTSDPASYTTTPCKRPFVISQQHYVFTLEAIQSI